MPAKVLPDRERFKLFTQYMEKEGFRKLSGGEFSSSFNRLDLQAPRPRKGRETGFVFTAKGLTVHVWTTFLEREGRAREEDAGWVVITEGDRQAYYSHPIVRTEGFLRKLFRNAKIAKERVLNRPLCPACRAFMDITQGRSLKTRYWSCGGKSRLHHIQTLPWDYGLSDESIIFLKAERKARRKYRERLEKAGKTVTPAMLIRRPWVVRNPQNKI